MIYYYYEFIIVVRARAHKPVQNNFLNANLLAFGSCIVISRS